MRRAARVDANQAEVVEALEAIGASVVDLSRVGEGVPDLLVGFQGFAWVIEVKTATGQLRESQRAFAATWRGPRVPVIRSGDQAVAWLTAQIRRLRVA